MGCEALTSINIPNSVTEIGNYAFNECKALTSVTIPESVTKIGYYYEWCKLTDYSPFSGCEALTSIIVATGNTVYDSRGNCNAIIETKTNRLIQGCANTVIPDSVTEIGYDAFNGCTALTSITIPNSVTAIGWGAFSGCKALTSVNIPDSVTWIGDCAFSKCKGLTSISIPNSVTEIGEHAFSECKALTSITIPESVTAIGNRPFAGCESLKEIILFQTDPSKIEVSIDLFGSELPKAQITLYVPKESVIAYQEHWPWSQFAAIYPLPMICSNNLM